MVGFLYIKLKKFAAQYILHKKNLKNVCLLQKIRHKSQKSITSSVYNAQETDLSVNFCHKFVYRIVLKQNQKGLDRRTFLVYNIIDSMRLLREFLRRNKFL